MRPSILFLLVAQAVLASRMMAQQSISVSNAASHNLGNVPASTIAPGSLIDIELNPQGGRLTSIDASTVIIAIQPSGSIQMIGSSGPVGILGLLSPDTPIGQASITLTFNGETSTPALVNIVPASFGLFTVNNGTGPAMTQNSLAQPVKPGDFVTLWGTGLGQSSDTPIVLLGGHPVAPTYAGPAPGLPGMDQINFRIPDDPTIPNGCYVGIAVSAGGFTSNLGMLSTSTDGTACVSPFGYTSDQLARLDAGQTMDLGQVDLFNMLGPPISTSEWFYTTGFTRMESAEAFFMSLNAVGVAQFAQPLIADDVYYGCRSPLSLTGAILISLPSLTVGNKLTLSNSQSSLDLPGGSPYTVQLPVPATADSPDQVPPPFFSAGDWQVSAPGSSSIAAFTGQFILPSPVHIANAADLATIDRTQDLKVTWNGSDYSASYNATIQLSSPTSTVVCFARASDGQLTIPSSLLQSAPQATLELLLVPKPDHLTILTAPLPAGAAMPVMLRYYSSEVIPVQIP